MLRLFAAFGIVFFSFQAWSADEGPLTKIQTTATSKIYWTLYSENGVSKIDVIEERNNEPQQFVRSWGFSNFDKALQFFNSKTSTFTMFTSQSWTSETQNVKTQTNKILWEAKNTWSWDWELKYAKWVAQNVDKTFMQKYEIPSDCADLAFTVRWIFARNNSLPVANKLSGTGKFMTHETVLKEWENLKTDPDWSKDKLFRTALRYLTRQTYTHSLMGDSYPVALNSEAITEGVHHLQLHDHSGHTMLVYKVDRSGGVPIRVLYSNVPIVVRELYDSPFSELSFPVENQHAFLRMRWPQKTASGWSLVPANKMPFYSLEQFSPDLAKEGPSFFVVAYKRVSPSFDPMKMIDETLTSIFLQLENRVRVVEDGYKFCSANDCSPGTAGDEDWSTPSRDKRLRDTYEALSQAFDLFRDMASDEIPTVLMDRIKNYQLNIQGQNYNFLQVYLSAGLELMDSDPRVAIQDRWALYPTAIMSRLERQLNSLFSQRDLKLQSNPTCTSTECPLGSKQWTEKSTLEIDGNISAIFYRIRLMCGIYNETCSEYNEIFKKSPSLRAAFSKAVTQHTSVLSPMNLRQGNSDSLVQFVPGSTIPLALSENVFLQSNKIFRQPQNDLFPEILCEDSRYNLNNRNQLVCVTHTGEDIDIDFLNSQMQSVNKVHLPLGKTRLISNYWIEKSDVFVLYLTDRVQIYDGAGNFVAEVTLPETHDLLKQRWLTTIDEENHLKILDLAEIQKGWIVQQVPSFLPLQDATVRPIKDTDYFFISDKGGIYVTNQDGILTSSVSNEMIHQFFDRSLFTFVQDSEFATYNYYEFENEKFDLKTNVKIGLNTDGWQLTNTDFGFYYGGREFGYSYYSKLTQQHNYLPWTKGKVVAQMNENYVVAVSNSTPNEYSLFDFKGRSFLTNKYVSLSFDKVMNLQRLTFFPNDHLYSLVFSGQVVNAALFSSSGFYYDTQEEESYGNSNQQPSDLPKNKFLFTISSSQSYLSLLHELVDRVTAYEVLLTTPAH